MHAEKSNISVRISPQGGRAFKLKREEILLVTDPFNEQVSVLFALKDGESTCGRSSCRSIDDAGKVWLGTGDVLYANASRKMCTLVESTVGRHDFLLTPCSLERFEVLDRHLAHHPTCFKNLQPAFAPFGTSIDRS